MVTTGRLIMLAAILAYALNAVAAPVHWATNGHYYEAVSFLSDVTDAEVDLAIAAMGQQYAVIGAGGIGWHEARLIAASRGGYLTSIESRAENDFVFSLVNDSKYWSNGAGPWFGGGQDLNSPNYREPDGAWIWINDYDQAHFEPMVFTNWCMGEPNNDGGYENVTHFCTEGTSLDPSPYWNDRPSNIPTAGFIIEYNVPEPATLSLLTVGGLILMHRRNTSLAVQKGPE